jgi:SagB-type dehydrogenase family enzyme
MARVDGPPHWQFRYRAGVALAAVGDGGSTLTDGAETVTFPQLRPTQVAILERLSTGVSEADLVLIPATEDRMWTRLALGQLLTCQLLDRHLVDGDRTIATVQVVGLDYRLNGRVPDSDAVLRMSRFAAVRQQDGDLVLESPLSRTRVVLADWRAMTALAQLGNGQPVGRIVWPDGINPAMGALLATELFREGFLEDATTGDTAGSELDRDSHAALSEWAFHDLLFHSRTRLGRHRQAYGGTYPQHGSREPLPAVKPPGPGEGIALQVPKLEQLRQTDAPFADVVEKRRSWRVPGPAPLTVDQLAEFLYRAARVRDTFRGSREEVTSRPYPGGGADYELEIYLAINRVDGLPPGLYHYDPGGHRLHQLAEWTCAVSRVAEQTARKAPPGLTADVTFLITARLMRLTYKYESIAYAVALKDLGVLYHGFYLTATAMGLAPCAVGGGDSDAFAAASGVSGTSEPQIGEFLLSSRDLAELPVNDTLKGLATDSPGTPTAITWPARKVR